MDEVLELAKKLSQAIAQSKRFKDLRATEEAVQKDEAALKVLKDREEVAKKLAEKEKKGEPIEPEEKRKLMEAEEALRLNPVLGSLWKAQADFHELLNLVNREITSALDPDKEGESPIITEA